VQSKIVDAFSYKKNVIGFEDMISQVNGYEKIPGLFSVKLGNWDDFADKVEKASSCTSVINNNSLGFCNWDSITASFAKWLDQI
jgi:hypothetical protein